MTDTQQPPDTDSPHPKKSTAPQSQVLDPINMARARHASAHGDSILKETRQVSTAAAAAKKAKTSAPVSVARVPTSNKPADFLSPNGCLLAVVVSLVFIVGGIVGGVIGGGLLLWAGNGNGIAMFGQADAPTPALTPTPALVATATPIPTPVPQATPAIEDIIVQTIPSVVTVINYHSQSVAFSEEGRVVGSGVIIDSRGYIATNNHVIENPGELRVLLADGQDVPAQLVSASPGEDLAILKVPVENLQAIKWGSSGSVRLGQAVYAIGSPLGDFPNSVSFGIVSGLSRALEMDEYVIDGLIQTDAAINRGSSGGPLINAQGEMIGINTFIIRESEDRGIAEGIAFAIPVDTARDLLMPWVAAHSGEAVPIPASGETGE
jgi:S1-C subfamily serine protease